jgi:hypothetical protein
MQQLGIGRKNDGLRLHVVSAVTRLRSLPGSASAAWAIRRLSASSRFSLSPSRLRRWLRSERSCGVVVIRKAEQRTSMWYQHPE